MRLINAPSVCGVGFGLHRSLLDQFSQLSADDINFLEIAPENWINVGGKLGKQLRAYTERFPFACHGLSLSLGGLAPLNYDLLAAVKLFLREHKIRCYSEHLSYSGDNHGNLYELLPLPFTEESVTHIASRIREAQDILGERIAIENTTYYYAPAQEMRECDFISEVVCAADCDILLDVNNLFVNSTNHQYDPTNFLKQLPGNRVTYIHIAGHDAKSEQFLVDTHGAPIVQGVWDLLKKTYKLFGVKPTLLERDNNIPALNEILLEVNMIKSLQSS